MGLGVEEPFTGGVEFLKDILRKTIRGGEACLAIPLPPAFVLNIALGVFTGDEELEPTPAALVQGVGKKGLRGS